MGNDADHAPPSPPASGVPSTPDATAAVAQSNDGSGAAPPAASPPQQRGRHKAFTISPALARHVDVKHPARKPDDPVYRPLRIFALDPAVSKLDGAVALLNVPWEKLAPGPRGRVFRIESGALPGDDGEPEKEPEECDLEDRSVLIRQGYNPSRSDRRFHCQMAYAVCSSVHAAFKAALGRDPVWGFGRAGGGEDVRAGAGVLRVRVNAREERNAYYDKADGTVNFGWFVAENGASGFMKGERVYTCLAHDVVVHELTHALLDGMRSHFTIPTQPDVLAFHEAFADLVAVFQHFSYGDVVLSAIRRSRGDITDGLLTDLARPLGTATDRPSPLRRAVDEAEGKPLRYDPRKEIHELGSVLVLAVFDAFNTIYRRKTERYVRLATAGTGLLPLGQLPPDLQAILAEEASQLASQFLSICIRAVDYCPPVDLEFGEFLRAVITADRELVPDDPWGYREAWIDAFRTRGILPAGVAALDEDALAWRPPKIDVPPIAGLSFAELRFRGDPGRPADAAELQRQARALGDAVTAPGAGEAFGLLRAGENEAEAPCIESIRSARRIGPDGQVLFDVVAEISQRVRVRDAKGRRWWSHGGCTVILGPEGEVRYTVLKRADHAGRQASQAAFMTRKGARFWERDAQELRPKGNVLGMLHERKRGRK